MVSLYSNVDEIWKTLGQYGRYQLRILFVTFFSALPMSYNIVSVVFIGSVPFHVCSDKTTFNKTYEEIVAKSSSNMSSVYLQCSTRVASNESGVVNYDYVSCDQGYVFSKSRDLSFVSEWELVCDRSIIATTSQTLVLGGMCVGAMATTLADVYGRKPVHIIANIGLFGVSLAMSFVKSLTGFLILRFFVGVFQQAMLLTVCIIWLELFPTRIRNVMSLIIAASWTASVCSLVPYAYFLRNFGWRWIQLGISVLSSLSLIEYCFVDESLRWLVVKGKDKQIKDLVLKAAKQNKVSTNVLQSVIDVKDLEIQVPVPVHSQKEVEAIELLQENSRVDHKTEEPSKVNIGVLKAWSEILRHKDLRTYALVVVYSWIVNNVTYYGIVLMTPSLAGDIYINFLYGCLAELVSNVILGVMLKYLGRRTMMMFYMTLNGVCLIVAGILQTVKTNTSEVIVTILMLVARGGVAASFNLAYIYTPEVFPTYLRNAGIGVSSSAARMAGMVAPFSSYLLHLAPWSPGVIFGGLCVLVALLFICLPETKYRELPQTAEDVKAWKSSKNK